MSTESPLANGEMIDLLREEDRVDVVDVCEGASKVSPKLAS